VFRTTGRLVSDLPRPSQASRQLQAEPHGPEADGFVRDLNSTGQQQLGYVPEAHPEPVIQPNPMADDLGWKPKAFVEWWADQHLDKPLLKTIIGKTETELLHKFIKGSAIQTIGDSLRKLVQPVSDPGLLKYLDESIRCAETNCIRASVVLAWCAVAFKIHQKLVSLTTPLLTAEFGKMKADKSLMFRTFTKDYTFTTDLDVQEAADSYLILMCRFLTYLDDTQYKHLKSALDLRNGCGHPTGYQPDPVKLQAYYSDITQLVLLNPKFA